MKKIIAFSGSNSSQSINQQLINIVVKYVEGIEVEVLNLRDYPAVMFGVDEEKENGFPDTMVDFFEKLGTADGFIVSSPEHNGSMPAVFKNTLDWVSRMGRKIFNEKPTVFLATSPGGRGGASVLQHLTTIMPFRGAKIVGSHSVARFKDKVVNGDLIDGEDKDAIIKIVQELTEVVSNS